MKKRNIILCFATFSMTLLSFTTCFSQEKLRLIKSDGTLEEREIIVPSNFTEKIAAIRQGKKQVVRSLVIEVAKNSELQADLELVEYQKDQLSIAWKNSQSRIELLAQPLLELSKTLAEDPKNERLRQRVEDLESEIQRASSRIIVEYEKQAAEVLLDHQWKRLYSIAAFLALRNAIPDKQNQLFHPYYLSSTLDCTEKEVAVIKEATMEAKAEMEKKIAIARKEAMKKIIESVPLRNRTKIQDLMGEKFKFVKSTNY